VANSSLEDRISAGLSDKISKEFTNKIGTDELRVKVKEIVSDCIDSVPYMKKIKEYAGEEIDNRIYKSAGYWIKTVAIPIIVTLITYILLIKLGIKP
jgi:hypothetical protein